LIEDRAGQAVGRAALFVPAAGWAAAAAGWISRERVAAASSFYSTESHALAMNPAPHHHDRQAAVAELEEKGPGLGPPWVGARRRRAEEAAEEGVDR